MTARSVDRRRLGRTALMPTAIGLGGAPLGNLYRAVDEAAAIALVDAAFDRGIRHFDTAPLYGAGLSEIRMGRALARRPRDEIVLSSKVGWILEDDPSIADDGPYVALPGRRRRCDYSRDGALRSIEASLKRLGTDRLDIVYIHDLDIAAHGNDLDRRFAEAMAGAYPALDQLRREGVVGAIGFGVNEWQVCMTALAHGDPDCFMLAGRYSLLDQSALIELLPLCLAREVGVVIGGPYNSGILATGAVPGAHYDYRPADEAILARTRALEVVCRDHGVPLPAAAVQFAGTHPAVVSVVPGMRSVGELETNLRLFDLPIPKALWQDMRRAGLIDPAAPIPGE